MLARRPVFVVIGLFMLAALAAAVSTVTASAHEDREVGELLLEVGFVNEPAYEGLQNGAHVQIARRGSADPVSGMQEFLKVEVTHIPSGVSRIMSVRELKDSPGVYRADFVPTAPGRYRFKVHGTIEGYELNEKFESGPGTFSEVHAQADVQFPEAVGSLRDVRAATRGAVASAETALDRASSASTLGTIALVVGAAGAAAGVAGAALALRRRRSV
jgi:hypothetical protein